MGALHKSLSNESSDTDDAKIATAADANSSKDDKSGAAKDGDHETGKASQDGEQEGSKEGDQKDDDLDDELDEDGEGELTKSFTFQLEDGGTVEAYDGAALLKAFQRKLNTTASELAETRAELAAAYGRLDQTEAQSVSAFSKSLEIMSAQGATLKAQQQKLQTLQDTVERLSNLGRGRQSVLTIAEKPDPQALAKAATANADAGIPVQEFMNKCLQAQRDGKLFAVDVAIADEHIRSGIPVPPHIVNKVLT